MKPKSSLPPKWADRLLSLICRNEVLENIQGDLYEIYQMRVRIHGKRKANLLYIRDVLSVLRPRLIKTVERGPSLLYYGIFKNHLKTSIRTIRHNALFSGINVIGLALSMSVGILMIVLLSELQSFDDFHEKKDRIYRVTTSRKPLLTGEAEVFASAPHWIGDQIKTQIPGVEKVLVLDREMTAELKTQDKGIVASGYYTTAEFFDVLSFNLKKGNPHTLFNDPGSIVLTEGAAKKLFGDSDPVDKILTVENNPDFKTGKVTGVIEDPPYNSHLSFDVLVSMKTKENSLDIRRRSFSKNPRLYAQSYVYLVLAGDASVANIESAISNVVAIHNSSGVPHRYSLQPMKEFVTREAGLQPGSIFAKKKIEVMVSLTVIVLLSACFNYTNLSLVRALRRSKEISVRKITGASRFQIFLQFMTETMVLTLFAAIVGVCIFFFIRTEFLSLGSLTSGGRSMLLLNLLPDHFFYFLLFAVVVGFVAGFFPSLILSKLKVNTLFDAGKLKLFYAINGRQILITCQTALSIGLIMCAVIVHKQYRYVLNYDLGYNTENIINVTVTGDYIELLENEYGKMPEVVEMSRSSMILGTREMLPGDAMPEDRSDTILFSSNYIDSRYLDMHGFELIAGTGFKTPLKEGQPQNTIIVNEGFLKRLGLGVAREAIGKKIWYFDEHKLEIQGVVKDFISKSLDTEAPEAFGFLNGYPNENSILGVKVVGNDLTETISKLEEAYRKLDPTHPFKATLYDDEIARTYEDSRATYVVVSFLALLAISISTLGLLGMAVYLIETRKKEICIRKVLGAEVRNVLILVSARFVAMIIVAAIIAIPITHYVVDKKILSEFLYRTEIGVFEMLSGLITVLIVAVLSIGWQVRNVVIQNPADSLREQ